MRTVRPGLLLLAATALLATACNDDDRPSFTPAPVDLIGRWTLEPVPCTGICPAVILPIYLLDLQRMEMTLLATQHDPCAGAIGGGQGSIEEGLVHLVLDCVPRPSSPCPSEVCLEYSGTFDGSRVDGLLTTTTRGIAAGDDCPAWTTTYMLGYDLIPGWPSFRCAN